MSWQNEVIQAFSRPCKWQMELANPMAACLLTRLHLNFLALLRTLPNTVRHSFCVLNGVRCEWVWNDGDQHSPNIVVYLHGGGFMAGSPATHRGVAWRLARECECRVLQIDYRLSPKHSHPAQINDVRAVLAALFAQGLRSEQWSLAGDSAGGNLALVGAIACRDENLPMPAAVLCFSPWTDLTQSGASIQHNKHTETLIPQNLLDPVAKFYYRDSNPQVANISPLFADLTGLPPLQLHTVAEELLRDDSLRIAARARAAGVSVDCQLWSDIPHGAALLADWLPEGRAMLHCGGVFLRHAMAQP
jgi:epsilon-lactone hydrolase